MWQYTMIPWQHALLCNEIDNQAVSWQKVRAKGLTRPLSTVNTLPGLFPPELANGKHQRSICGRTLTTAVLNAEGMWRLRQHAFPISSEDTEMRVSRTQSQRSTTPLDWRHGWRERTGEVVLQLNQLETSTVMCVCVCVWDTALK